MALTNPVDLFTEFENLNGGPGSVDPGGFWRFTLQSGGGYDGTLCTSPTGAIGTWTNETIAPGDTIAGGSQTAHVDLLGTSCGQPAEAGGVYIFAYVIPASGGCPEIARAFSISLFGGTISYSRADEACSYESLARSPIDNGHVAPNITISTGDITPHWRYNLNTERRSLENCTGGASTVYTNLEINGLTQADYGGCTKGGGAATGDCDDLSGNNSPYVTMSMATTDLIADGGFINLLTLSSGTLNLSGITKLPGDSSFVFAAKIKTEIINQLGNNNEYWVDVSANQSGPAIITITFGCANGATNWKGFDTATAFMSWNDGGGANITTSVSKQVSGDYIKGHSGHYTDPCGNVHAVQIGLCPNEADQTTFVLGSCNYNTIVLTDVNDRAYYVHDFWNGSESSGRYSICNTVNITPVLSLSTICPTTPTEEWQVAGGSGEKEFIPLENDRYDYDCDGCQILGDPYCFPELDDIGDVSANGQACNDISTSSWSHSISTNACAGFPGTLTAIDTFDEPAVGWSPSVFTSVTTNVGLGLVQATMPANATPRTYYFAHRVTIDGEDSYYMIVRCNLTKGNCCT